MSCGGIGELRFCAASMALAGNGLNPFRNIPMHSNISDGQNSKLTKRPASRGQEKP
jgi:hypothetical protein